MSQYQSGADGCSDYGADGALRGLKMKGGGGGKKKGGGGNMNFKRVVPSFLAGYTQMLTGKAGLPRGSGADDEDGPTRVSAAEAAGKFGGGSGEDEEGAAVGEEEEAFQRAALERAQAEHGAAQAVASAQSDKRVQKLLRQKERARVEAMRAAREAADAAEAASGKHTFRSAPKRPRAGEAGGGGGAGGAGGGGGAEAAGGKEEGGSGREERKKKKKQKKKVSASLLSFGDDEDEEGGML